LQTAVDKCQCVYNNLGLKTGNSLLNVITIETKVLYKPFQTKGFEQNIHFFFDHYFTISFQPSSVEIYRTLYNRHVKLAAPLLVFCGPNESFHYAAN